MKYYAGIGSRKTPPPVLAKMELIGGFMARHGWTLRSGGAGGADQAFERGCYKAGGEKEIWNPRDEEVPIYNWAVDEIRGCCWEKPFHKMIAFTRVLLARNAYQILGMDGKTPVDFVVCWSDNPMKKGFQGGGTRYAVRLARYHGLTVFNLFQPNSNEACPDALQALRAYCRANVLHSQ